MNLKEFFNNHLPAIETNLVQLVEKIQAPSELKESMLYSLKAGGKRVRPMYVVAVAEMYGISYEDAYTVGAAVEMIHTYSLIHDD